ncbi:unnamed protein product [Rhodiola kirilowii]
MDKSSEGDPTQHLIEELLSRAAKKAGMDLHDLSIETKTILQHSVELNCKMSNAKVQ